MHLVAREGKRVFYLFVRSLFADKFVHLAHVVREFCQVEDDSQSESSDDEPGVRRSAITGKKIKMKLENQTTEDHARAAGRKHLLQFMNSQF